MTTALTRNQRDQLEAELQARRRVLDRQMAEHQDGESRIDYAHEVLQQDGHDAAQRSADREVELARADRELAELGLISEALQRMAHDDYGRCGDCDRKIAFERLRLTPWTRLCIDCAAKAEGPLAGLRHTL